MCLLRSDSIGIFLLQPPHPEPPVVDIIDKKTLPQSLAQKDAPQSASKMYDHDRKIFELAHEHISELECESESSTSKSDAENFDASSKEDSSGSNVNDATEPVSIMRNTVTVADRQKWRGDTDAEPISMVRNTVTVADRQEWRSEEHSSLPANAVKVNGDTALSTGETFVRIAYLPDEREKRVSWDASGHADNTGSANLGPTIDEHAETVVALSSQSVTTEHSQTQTSAFANVDRRCGLSAPLSGVSPVAPRPLSSSLPASPRVAKMVAANTFRAPNLMFPTLPDEANATPLAQLAFTSVFPSPGTTPSDFPSSSLRDSPVSTLPSPVNLAAFPSSPTSSDPAHWSADSPQVYRRLEPGRENFCGSDTAVSSNAISISALVPASAADVLPVIGQSSISELKTIPATKVNGSTDATSSESLTATSQNNTPVRARRHSRTRSAACSVSPPKHTAAKRPARIRRKRTLSAMPEVSRIGIPSIINRNMLETLREQEREAEFESMAHARGVDPNINTGPRPSSPISRRKPGDFPLHVGPGSVRHLDVPTVQLAVRVLPDSTVPTDGAVAVEPELSAKYRMTRFPQVSSVRLHSDFEVNILR